MVQHLAGATREHGAEIALSVGLVVTSFLAILAVGEAVLPEGTSLQALIREREPDPGAASVPGARELRFAGAEGRQPEIARLAQTTRRVKDKPSTSIAWRDAESGMALENRHSIQTFDDASATIAFDSESSLELGENSLVVLQSFDRRDDGSDRRASLLLLGGEIRGKLQVSEGKSLDVDVEIAGNRVRLRPEAGKNDETEFRVEVDEKTASSRVSVFSGEAEVTSGESTTRIEPRQVLEVSPDGRIGEPVDMLAPPRLRAPRDERITFRSRPPSVTFSWDAVAGAEEYLLTVATDPAFQEIFYRKKTTATRVQYGRLPAGRYFWRVMSLAAGLEGAPGPSARLVIELDSQPPALRVTWPSGTVDVDHAEIVGRTEPGARVFISNEPVAVDSQGRFTYFTRLRRGANVIVIEAVDAAGNASYDSQVVNAEFAGESAP
jgi:hypothetical protein